MGGVLARGIASPLAPACIGVVVVLGPRADGDISSPLGAVIAGVDRPLGLPWAYPYRLDALKEPVCPRGWLLCSRHAMTLGRESSRVLALESSWRDGAAVAVPPFPGVVTAFEKNCRGVSLRELVLSATRFDPLVAARCALGEPASSDARASRRHLTVRRSVSRSLLVV